MIVAIESASTDLSVALAHPDGSLLVDDAWTSAQRQSAELLPRLLSLLDREGRTLADATAIAVGIGPGSFTGLRVAMSLAKGLAVALEVPLVGVPSLEAWLTAAREVEAALARAGAREAYLLRRGDPAPAIVDRDVLTDLGRAVAPRELAEAFGIVGSVPPDGAAAAVARMAAARLAADPAGDEVATLEPAYLRPPRGTERHAAGGAVQWR